MKMARRERYGFNVLDVNDWQEKRWDVFLRWMPKRTITEIGWIVFDLESGDWCPENGTEREIPRQRWKNMEYHAHMLHDVNLAVGWQTTDLLSRARTKTGPTLERSQHNPVSAKPRLALVAGEGRSLASISRELLGELLRQMGGCMENWKCLDVVVEMPRLSNTH